MTTDVPTARTPIRDQAHGVVAPAREPLVIECSSCGWQWPLHGLPPDGAECDSCGADDWGVIVSEAALRSVLFGSSDYNAAKAHLRDALDAVDALGPAVRPPR